MSDLENLNEESQAAIAATIANQVYSKVLQVDEYRSNKKNVLFHLIISSNLAFCFADLMFAMGSKTNDLKSFLLVDAFLAFLIACCISFLFQIDKRQIHGSVRLFRVLFLSAMFLGFVGIKVEAPLDTMSNTSAVRLFLFVRITSHFAWDTINLYQFF